MRRKIGWLLLGAGVVGLSYWGHENHAETIEGSIKAEADALTVDTRHATMASVSGRDITFEGLVHDEAERERLLAAAAELKGYRVIHDKLTMLPRQDNYSFSATKSDDTIGEIAGFIPDEAARSTISAIAADADLDALALASGAPDAAWADAAGAGLGGLAALQSGALTIEGQSVTLRGTVDTTAEFASLRSAADAGPSGYDWDLSDVRVLRPDVETYQMVAEKTGADWTLGGHVPDQTARNRLFESVGEADHSGVSLAANAPQGWSDRLNGAIAAVSGLENGRIEMTDGDLTITGEAQTQADYDAFQAALAGISTQKGIVSTVAVLTPPEPVATTPAFDITLDPISGLTVSGDVPAGLDAAKIAEILGVAKHSGETSEIEGETAVVQTDKLAQLGAVAGEFESLKISFDGDAMTVVGETLFDADPARLQEILSQIAVGGDSIQITRSPTVFEDGFKRENALTGGSEIFTSGYWIPEFAAGALTAAECAARTEAAVNETKIRFRPGSAEIDSVSRRVLNNLTSIIGACMKREPDTRILIGGHTDAVGTEEDNLVLSNDRAANVRAALVARGLPETQLSAQGFGELQPIADNATDEGRATNRRTTFEWIN